VKEILLIILILFFNSNSFANFKEIKKKAVVNKPEIIFPIPKNLKNCQTKLYVSPELNKIEPILKVKAPIGYGLDDRYDYALSRFTNFTFPCSGGNIEACEHVKNTILNWAKANAAKRTGPSDHEGRHWNDTLTVNLYVASPMLAAYSFAKQIISIPQEEDRIIKNWFKKIVKKNQHLLYGKTYDYGGASGTPKRAHNHALSSAVAHMQLGILIDNDKEFKKAFRNYESAIKHQRKDGSLPIEVRRGGRAMFYQGRAMNALAVIAIIAEHQGYNIWELDFKGKNYHNLVKFFIDFTENNELVFKYAKENRSPGPAKNYKVQDLKSNSGSNWGWLYAYASRFPDHENIQRLKQWSENKNNLNNYQRKIVTVFENISKRGFGSASWTVVEPYCHFTK
jgi:poly(beta-D-mannuronate) lyase|tara:strand:- start:103 stop:1287 length:1185 start_codon:yes stop_codon:yes gene_type:complete